MSGGNLVIGTFYWQDRSDGGWGSSWGNLELIDPLFGGSCDYESGNLSSIVDHPLTEGLNSLYCSFHRGGPSILRENATAVAWWDDGDPLIAFNQPDGLITAVTMWPVLRKFLPSGMTVPSP